MPLQKELIIWILETRGFQKSNKVGKWSALAKAQCFLVSSLMVVDHMWIFLAPQKEKAVFFEEQKLQQSDCRQTINDTWIQTESSHRDINYLIEPISRQDFLVLKCGV